MPRRGMALPHMQGAFSAAPDRIARLVTGFIAAAAMDTRQAAVAIA